MQIKCKDDDDDDEDHDKHGQESNGIWYRLTQAISKVCGVEDSCVSVKVTSKQKSNDRQGNWMLVVVQFVNISDAAAANAAQQLALAANGQAPAGVPASLASMFAGVSTGEVDAYGNVKPGTFRPLAVATQTPAGNVVVRMPENTGNSSSKDNTGLILGLTLGLTALVLVFLLVALVIVLKFRSRRTRSPAEVIGEVRLAPKKELSAYFSPISGRPVEEDGPQMVVPHDVQH